jgi:phage terminase Nu1 subunit (DNA packaging protein)
MAKLVGRQEVARAFGRSPRWISRLVEHGMPKAGRGQYDLAQCMLWYIRYLQREMERRELPVNDTVGMSIRRERQRLVKAQADREEFELAQKRSELIPADVYAAETAKITNRACEAFLTLTSMAPKLEGLNRMAIKSKLDAAVREVLTTLSKGGQDNN